MPRLPEPGVGDAAMDSVPCERIFEAYMVGLGRHEGGLADLPYANDPGGLTFRGISQRYLNGLRARSEWSRLPERPDQLDDGQIKAIYRSEFFDRPYIGELARVPGLSVAAPTLAEQIFDAGVHHGTVTAGRWLQRALDGRIGTDLRTSRRDGTMRYDGIIGPRSREAVAEAVRRGAIACVNDDIVDQRTAFMRALSNFAVNPGWITRAESFRMDRARLTSSTDLPRLPQGSDTECEGSARW